MQSCGPWPPSSSVHGILQAKILEWIDVPSSGDLPYPGVSYTSRIGRRVLFHSATWEAIYIYIYSVCVCVCVCVCVLVTQSCSTLCHPMNCSPPGIFQAGILERVATTFSRGSSQPRGQIQVFCVAGRFFTI